MGNLKNAAFRFGDWQVSSASNTLHNGALRHQVEPRAMDVLVALCERAGLVVTTDELLEQCWGSTIHGDNPLHKTITQLRRVLGDSAAAPLYIETIRKRGYRTLAEVATGDAAVEAVAGNWRDGSPFRGLQAFDSGHAAIFFGRAGATAALARALQQQVEAGRALQLVLGASGSGKTSLIRAGLLPALAAPGHPLAVRASADLDLGELAEGQLFAGLGGAMLDWQVDGVSLFDGCNAHDLGRQLETDPGAVAACLEQALARAYGAAPARVALVIDRFEAVFAQAHIGEAQRQAMVAALDTLARAQRVVVIVACRNDFYPRIAAIAALLEGKANGAHFDLGPPSHAEIAQIIRLPALAADLSFGTDPLSGDRLDELLCRAAAASPDALPLLQYTLQELYRLRGANGELGVEAYRQLGGLDGVLGARAEQVIAGLGAAPRASLARVLSLVVTISADDERVTSRRASWSALEHDAERELVAALVEARLFVSQLVGHEAGFGVAHEALLRRWARVGDWVAAHRDSLHARARVAQLTARWTGHGRPADLLIPHGRQLDEARGLLSMAGFSLSAQELDLIRVSGQKARRRERIRMAALALIAGLAVLASAAGVSAFGAKQLAQHRRAEAEGLMGFMLGDFADKLRPLARLDLLDGVSAKALEYLAVSDGDELTTASLTQRAKALQVIGEVRIARGDPKAAAEALQAAHAILQRQLAAAPRDPELLKQIGASAFWLGKLRLDQGDWDQAYQRLVQYRDFADRYSALAPADVDAWIEQSYAHNSLGSLALKRGNPRAAAAEFALSIALKNKAVSSKPADRTLAKDLADSLSWAASTNEAMGELGAAGALYERQFQLATQLHESGPGDALWSDKLAEALQHQGALKLALGQEAAALADFGRAETLLQANVAADPANRMWQASLGFVQMAKLRATPGRHDTGARLAQWNALVSRFAELTRIDAKNAGWAKHQALALQLTGAALLAAGRGAAALRAADESQRVLEALHTRNKADVRTRALLATTLLMRADIAFADKQPQLAQTACARALAVLGPDTGASSDFRILDPWIRSQLCISQKSTASDAMLRLSRIGYREQAYMQYLSRHN